MTRELGWWQRVSLASLHDNATPRRETIYDDKPVTPTKPRSLPLTTDHIRFAFKPDSRANFNRTRIKQVLKAIQAKAETLIRNYRENPNDKVKSQQDLHRIPASPAKLEPSIVKFTAEDLKAFDQAQASIEERLKPYTYDDENNPYLIQKISELFSEPRQVISNTVLAKSEV